MPVSIKTDRLAEVPSGVSSAPPPASELHDRLSMQHQLAIPQSFASVGANLNMQLKLRALSPQCAGFLTRRSRPGTVQPTLTECFLVTARRRARPSGTWSRNKAAASSSRATRSTQAEGPEEKKQADAERPWGVSDPDFPADSFGDKCPDRHVPSTAHLSGDTFWTNPQ